MNDHTKSMCRKFLNENEMFSKIGSYKMLPKRDTQKNSYCNNANPGGIDSVCNVSVTDKNPFQVLELLIDKKGISMSRTGTRFNSTVMPTVVQAVGKRFVGTHVKTLEDPRDVQFLLRTNFAGVCDTSRHTELTETECLYVPIVTTIRDFHGNILPYDKCYAFSMILTYPLSHPDLINDEQMTSKDFLRTMKIIETIFHTAIFKQNKILIIPPFGMDDDDENPPEDIVNIFNYCIIKYGHRFQSIIFCVPEQYDSDILELFKEKIVKPQVLTKQVDDKYESKQMHFALENMDQMQGQ